MMKPTSEPSLAKPSLPPQAAELLTRLRARIRWYVWCEGLALAVIVLVVGYWLGLLLDYGPVLLGASEMPAIARRIYLCGVLLLALIVFYRTTLRYAFRELPNRSLAILIERHYPQFRDSLITAVEASERGLPEENVNPRMVTATLAEMESRLAQVQLGPVFRWQPIVRKLAVAGMLLLALASLGLFARDVFQVWTPRFLLLSNEPWPRYAYIEVVGFMDGQRKVARGDDLTINVRADATRSTPPPAVCTIYYRTADGETGRVNMSRDGEPRGGHQYYVYNGKPFRSLLNDVRFDVIGFDYRVNDQVVQVVESPAVIQVELRSELPAYTGLLPRTEVWNAGMQLPIGTQLTLSIKTNKDLRRITLTNPDTEEVLVREVSALPAADRAPTNAGLEAGGEKSQLRQVVHRVAKLDGRYTLLISLEDTDGIVSQQPFRVSIGAVADELPQVEAVLDGIGGAITPNARLPVSGSIKDDYGVDASWYLIAGRDREDQSFPLELDGSGQFQTNLDLRQRQADEAAFRLQPGDKISFSLQARDRYDLSDEPHLGQSEPYELQVVRDDELLAILDGREVGLRRRFEQMKDEFAESRDTLQRVRTSWNAESEAANATETSSENSNVANNTESETAVADESAAQPTATDDQVAQNIADTRRRWSQWASQQTDRSKEELTSLAAAFEDIREELVNNRVDTPERETRLAGQIIGPLRDIADEMLPRMRSTLDQLEKLVANTDRPVEASLVVEQANEILNAMDRVLQQMVELEDYAELVNIMRGILEDQQRLMNETKEEQKRRLLDLFK